MSRFAVFAVFGAFWALLGVGCAREVPALPLAPVALFEGRVENGQLVYLRTTPVAASTSSTEQGLSVVPEDRNGVRGTSDIDAAVELTTENGNGFPAPTLTPDGCGAGVDAFDVFAGLRNFHDVDLSSAHIEILSLSGDGDDHSLCNSDTPSPNLLVDGTTPLDTSLGLIRYGHEVRDDNGFGTPPSTLVPRPFGTDATARARRWRFRNGGGSFGFRGRVLANRCDDDCTPGVAINEGPSAPVGSRPFPTVNGTVLAVAEGDGVVYLGGSFTTVNPRTTTAIFTAKNSAQTGTLLSTHPDLEGGVVDSVVGDGAGGFYVGGTFTTVDGVSRPRLVHVLSSGAVDTAFAPTTSTTGTISALALDAARTTLWVGRTATPFLAALDTASGASKGLPLVQPNDEVRDILVTSGSNQVHVAGQFENYGGNSQLDKVVLLNATTGLVVGGFIPPTFTSGTDVEVECLLRDGNTLYVGGDFTAPRARAAAISATGTALQNWDPRPNGEVKAMGLSGGNVYLAGSFTTLRRGNRDRTAAVQASPTANNPQLRAWNPGPNGSVVNSLVIDGSDVYLGGDFTSLQGATRNGVAVVDVNSGDGTPTVRTYAPNPSATTTRQLAISGTTVAIGGGEQTFGGTALARLAAVDLDTMEFLPFDANITDGEVRTLALDGGRLYLGGTFTSVGGQARLRAAAVNAATLALDAGFVANTGNFVTTGAVDVIAVGDSHVYFSGDFNAINGAGNTIRQARLGRTDKNGVTDSAWFPASSVFLIFNTRNFLGGLDGPGASAIVEAGEEVFVGGGFLELGDQNPAGSRLVRLNGTTGDLVQNFAPGAAVQALHVSPDGKTVYAAGTFTSILGQNRNRVAAIDVATNTLTPLDPGGFNGSILGMDLSGHSLVVGGTFTTPSTNVAAIDLDGGTVVSSFSPLSLGTGSVRAITFAGNGIVFGGDFNSTVDVAGDPVGTPRINNAMVFAE